jgi:hypothetical protein
MCVFDIDADGDLDLLTAGSGAGVYVYKNDGSANFIQKYKLTLSTYPSNVYNADFDGDGDMDLVAVSMMGFSLIVNDGQGNFSEKTILNTVNKNNLQDNKNLPLKTLSIADIDLDGDMDILATATSNYSYMTDMVNLLLKITKNPDLHQLILLEQPILTMMAKWILLRQVTHPLLSLD